MSAEIQTIRLYRKSLEEDIEYSQENIQEENEGKCYYATDYFDVLFVSEKKLEDTFSSVMNLKNVNSEVQVTSVQSYTLYFSEEMFKKYEETGKYANRQSPFAANDELAFLSIIQVHITPEVLRRMQYKEGTLCRKEKAIILETFIDDLYHIIDSFCAIHKEKKLVYRIYQVLSAGDFAVALKSQYPEDSFYIAANIRRRVAGIEIEDRIAPSEWAIYKTYTLLTMEGMLGQQKQTDDSQRKEGYYVIRGCYSCKYWSCQIEFDNLIAQKGVSRPDDILGLNGRYDFSMKLSEDEFYQIYPEIVCYKNGIMTQEYTGKKYHRPETQKTRYLAFLLENGFLSYINERYFLADIKHENLPNSENVSSFVLIDSERISLASLKAENMAYMNKLKVNYDRMREKYKRLEITHQNFGQYLELLQKQIVSCYTLNQQPDTRAYACGLGELLETVLASLEVYRQLYEDAEESMNKIEIMDLIVDYVRDSVHALDSYAEYIRNNNLQSLQTPNYNIQSSMGMEKILIGYSEYLRRFLQYYQDLMGETRESKEFYPIVLPDLHKTDICVEVLFPEGNGDNWQEEQNIRSKSEQNNKCLLLIDSPTLAELGDIPVFMAMLFHEVAHQLRYESRRDRNGVILKIMIKAYMERIANHMTEKFKRQSGEQDEKQKLENMLSRVLIGVACQWFMNEGKLKDEELDTPLFYFKRLCTKKVESLIYIWMNRIEVQNRAKRFLNELKEAVDTFGKDETEYIDLFYNFIVNHADSEEGQFQYIDIVRIEKSAFAVVWRVTYDMLMQACAIFAGQETWLLDLDAVRQWCEDEDEVLFIPLWKNSFKNVKYEQQMYINNLWKIFHDFALWLEHYFKKTDCREKNNVYAFFDQVYIELCREWEKENLEFIGISTGVNGFPKVVDLNEYRSWALAGRYLGLDKETKENKEKYDKYIADVSNFKFRMEDVEIDKYREVTSDIFMYSIMNLSPFEYLNLISLIIPGNELEKPFDLDRIITVLYVMMDYESPDSDREDCHQRFLKMCGGIIDHLRYYYSINLFHGKEDDLILSEFGHIKKRWDEEIGAKKYIDINSLVVCLEYSKERAEDNTARKKLQHLEKLVRLLERVIFEGCNGIVTLERDKNLLDDYRRGAKALKQVRYKMENGLDSSMKELLDLCSCNVEYLKKYHYKTGIVKNIELNKKSIEFLLSMYYGRKIRNTRRIKDEN